MQLIYRDLEADVVRRTNAVFLAQNFWVEVLPDQFIIPRKYVELGESIRSLPVFEDDVWMVSYPRTGSSWAQEMVWLLGHKLDYKAAEQDVRMRSPFIEFSALFSMDHHKAMAQKFGNTVELVRNLPRPRFARSHLSWQLLPEQFETVKPKIVYTARNPKDQCVSYYHYLKMRQGFIGDFDQFVDLFLDGYAPIGPYWKHVLPFWKRSQEENVLFIKYEDMVKDLPSVVGLCARFLGVENLLDASSLQKLCDHLTFDKMRSNMAINLPKPYSKFIRNGKIGDWRNHMGNEMSERFDEWIELHFRGSGLSFDYE
ncbi:luciferin sulfotransferase-like [Drosophila ficusphila]|uniref:luciferin sulfotransferase-like n=1 Tax=Drosophila ficusphila TaxID=30025 RepID=UPI0007E89584|nr:luciferin sulfotransferase-like [Drosophila ficusphila]